MANIKSAKKRVKVIATKTARNKAAKSALKTAIKKAYFAVDTNADNKQEAVRFAIKRLIRLRQRVFCTRTPLQEENPILQSALTLPRKRNFKAET